ncbi:MAG: universal stress protein [Bacteroidota bacterium]
MENVHKPVIVPWDFTHVAEFAFDHALNISKILDREIILLHIVENPDAAKPSLEKLENKARELSAEHNVKIHSFVKAGNIFDTIRETAHEHKAEMAVMGTHGRKGMQKILGSWALKVMAHSKVPFLVVQKKPEKSNFNKIVIPVDFGSENKEQVKWISYLSEKYKAEFLIFRRKVSDKGFKKKIASNLHYVKSFLKNNDVSYEIHVSEGRRSFEKETVQFAKEHNADLILVMVTRNIGFFDYLMAAREQYIIANPERIPVMCLNPRPVKLSSGFRATGG